MEYAGRREHDWRSSPSMERRYYRGRRERYDMPEFRRERWRPLSEEDESPPLHRRRRSASWRHDSREDFRRPPPRRSPSPRSRRRDSSPSPYYSPRRRYRPRSDSRDFYDSRRRHRKRRRYSSREERPRRRYSSRRHHRRRDASSSSPSSSPRGAPASPVLRNPMGVVSEDEQEAAASKAVLDHVDPSAKKKKRSHSGGSMSATSSRDDTVGHFRGGAGTMIDNRYRITRDVGMGTFGRVVECLDLKRSKSRSKNRVAIKIVRNVKRYYDSALIEADIVQDVNRRGGRGTSHFAFLHNAFTFSGHFCLVFESLGPSLYDFLKRHDYQPFPMACVRDFSRQLLEALEFLHSFGLIHTDLKPENILLTSYRERCYKWRGRTYQIPESTKIKVIDFGGATYDDEKKSSVINTRQYRAPEVIFGLGWSTPSDLWSAGCILAELYMGELLFATHDNLEHLALMERAIGPFSRRMLKRARNSPIVQQAFDQGRHLMGAVLNAESAAYVKKMRPLSAIIPQEDGRFLSLLRRLLVIDPDERAPASELVNCRV